MNDADRQQITLCGGGDGIAAGMLVAIGHGYRTRGFDAHILDTFCGADTVELEVVHRASVDAIPLLLVQALAGVHADHIVRAAKLRGGLTGQGIVHGVTEQECGRNERGADQDGDAGRNQHSGAFLHEFHCDGKHGFVLLSCFPWVSGRGVRRHGRGAAFPHTQRWERPAAAAHR